MGHAGHFALVRAILEHTVVHAAEVAAAAIPARRARPVEVGILARVVLPCVPFLRLLLAFAPAPFTNARVHLSPHSLLCAARIYAWAGQVEFCWILQLYRLSRRTV